MPDLLISTPINWPFESFGIKLAPLPIPDTTKEGGELYSCPLLFTITSTIFPLSETTASKIAPVPVLKEI